MSDWLKLPDVVAPSPDNKDEKVTYGVSEDFVGRNAYVRRYTPTFQLWTHVVGELPPINNIHSLGDRELHPDVMTLMDAVACFRGVNRPYVNEENGGSVVVYVLTPAVSIAFERSMVCMAKAVKVPTETVLTVQVRPRDALQDLRTDLNGLVTRLEFVSGTVEEPTLPARYKDRYDQTLWRK